MNRTTQRWLLTAGAAIAAGLGLAAHDAATNTAHAHDRTPAATERADERPVRALLDAVTDALPVKVELPTPAASETAPKPTTPPAPEPEPEPTRDAEPAPPTPATPDPDPDPEPEPEPSGPARGTDATPTPSTQPTPPTTPLCDVPLVDGVCQ
ncbi:hypothetical protein ACFWC6_32950, partial [Micromonospora chalcea]